MKIVKQSATILAMTPYPALAVERAGRVCYKSEAKLQCSKCGSYAWAATLDEENPFCHVCVERAEEFVRKLIKRGHESVLEHATITVLFVTDRGISHELVRHRIASYSQESTRYCNYGDGEQITVIEPDFSEAKSEYENPAEAAKMNWHKAVFEAERQYNNLIDQGVSPQWARSVLPTCLKTEIVSTFNMRTWRHIFQLRALNPGAHPQIRQLTKLTLDHFMRTSAAVFFADIAQEWKDA